MKRKIAILLAAVMTTAMIPMNVMASSANSVNKSVTVAVDKMVSDVYLKVQPNDEIISGDTISITVEGGEFLKDTELSPYNCEKLGSDMSYRDAMELYDANAVIDQETGKRYLPSTAYKVVYDGAVIQTTTQLPYQLSTGSNATKEMTVRLFPLPSKYVGYELSSAKVKTHYYIPLPIKAKTAGDIKIKVDANETSITGGTYTIATATSSSGSTSMTVAEVKKFEDSVTLDTISIKENVKDTFKESLAGGTTQTLTLRLSGGFKFVSNSDTKMVAGLNASFADVAVTSFDKNEVTFTMPGSLVSNEDRENDSNNRKKPVTLKIQGLKIVAEDEDKDWGDVNLSVKGAGATSESIKVAERAVFNFKLTALEEPKTIIAGRFEKADTVSNRELQDSDCVAAEVKFEEQIVNSWITQRKLEFSLPEGVKVYAAEFNEIEYISQDPDDKKSIPQGKSEFTYNKDTFGKITLVNDGRTLKVEKGLETDGSKNGTSATECAKFKMKLYLSADADYEGEVKLSVAGGGIAEGEVEPVVIANVIAPIKIETAETKSNMGYQAVKTADITVTEAKEGMLLKNGEVVVALDASYGTKEVGFADENIVVEASDELTIKNVNVTDGEITFIVDRSSYSKPASFTIKNVKVGTTRSVPYGSYDVKVFGNAVIDNYNKQYVVDEKAGFFDTTSSYSFKNYLTIGTVTGTLDAVVKVSIGEKTILIDDQAYDMDVAPYIQATSNSTMVPLRFVSVALGVDSDNVANPDESNKISFNANTKTATIFYGAGAGQKIIQFQAGSNVMSVDGTGIPMEYGVTAEIKDGRMFVPFRALGQALGVNVNWDADTRTATYNAQ